MKKKYLWVLLPLGVFVGISAFLHVVFDVPVWLPFRALFGAFGVFALIYLFIGSIAIALDKIRE